MALNIKKQQARNLRKLIIGQTRSWLDNNQNVPDEEKISIKAVNKKLLIKHCSLILWCQEHRKVQIHIHNLHDIIANYTMQYDLYKVRTAPEIDQEQIVFVTVIDEEDSYFKTGTIRPDDFQAFFSRGDS